MSALLIINELVHIFTAEVERNKFMTQLDCRHGLPHIVSRISV